MLFGFLFHVANFLRNLLQRILVVGVLKLEIWGRISDLSLSNLHSCPLA